MPRPLLVIAPVLLLSACTGSPGDVRPAWPPLSFRVDRWQAEPSPGLPPSAVATPSDAPPDLPSSAVGSPVASDAPTPATPPPTMPPSSPPTSGSGSSGGGSSGAAPLAPEVVVRDEFDLPVPEVTALFGAASVLGDANGSIGRHSAFPNERVELAKDGYVGSAIYDLDLTTTLHLRHAGGFSGSFDRRHVTLRGHVNWPVADLGPTGVFWQDTTGTAAATATVDGQGDFAISLTTTAPGEPFGALVAVGADAGGALLYGATEAFKPFSAPVPPTLPMVRTDRTLTYAMANAPPTYTVVRTRLELVRAGMPVVVFGSSVTPTGTYAAPTFEALGGELRVAFEAANEAGDQASFASVRTEDATVTATLLPALSVTTDPGTRTVAWTALLPAVKGYRVETHFDGQTGPAWEAWTTSGTSVTVPEAAWPAPGRGEVTVEAVEAPGLTSRSLASLDGPRRLRIAPWTAQQTYAVSSRRVRL